jgi:hypothetical protein
VQTVVQFVPALTLTSPQIRTVAPGGIVYFSHTLTNDGNGNDSFTLNISQVGGGDFNFNTNSIKVYADADGDGIADNTTDLHNLANFVALNAGGTFKFVVAAAVPGGATSGSGIVDVTATINGGTPTAITNHDTVNVSQYAVVNVVKTISDSSGVPGDFVQYTLTFTNTGDAVATNNTV